MDHTALVRFSVVSDMLTGIRLLLCSITAPVVAHKYLVTQAELPILFAGFSDIFSGALAVVLTRYNL